MKNYGGTNMKRLILTVLCLSLVLSLAACGSAPAPTEPPLFATEAPTEAPHQEAPTAPAQTPTEAPADYTLSGQVLVDNEDCAFTVTGTEFNEHLGLQLQVLCENKSDRTLMFSCIRLRFYDRPHVGRGGSPGQEGQHHH